MSRVVNLSTTGKTRNQQRRTIAEDLRLLMFKRATWLPRSSLACAPSPRPSK